MIHPSAIVHPKAEVDASVWVGPYAVIDENVQVGPNCRIGPHVHLTGHTSLGADNYIHTGCVLGDAPQDWKYRGEPTGLRVGEGNIFREHVTAHRSNKELEETLIGSHNFFMAHSHVGHNAQVGNHSILANGALLAGHVVVQDRSFLSGNCMVHQYVRVGTLSLMQGGAALSKDLPPFTVSHGVNLLCGLNTVGLRRAGFSSDQRLELKRLYHMLFRSRAKLSEALAAANMEFKSDTARVLLEFVASSKRGICADTGHTAEPETEEV